VSSELRSLLIMSCSQCKRKEPRLLPAIERYDGPTFRVLRRFLQAQPSKPLDIFIVSAKFGLISADQPIPNYDQPMTLFRAEELRPQIIAAFKHILSGQSYQELCLCVGKDYLQALDKYDTVVTSEMGITIVAGSPGKRLAELHRWLYGSSLEREQFSHQAVSNGKVHLRGIDIDITSTQVLEVARRALLEGQGNPANYYSWYIQVDGKRVAPKWLVSNLLGLPLNAFTTGDARRLLMQLGIEVRHA
jgi:hypothetical protein